MKARSVTVSFLVVVRLLRLGNPSGAAYDPNGDIQFLCGPVSPENSALLP